MKKKRTLFRLQAGFCVALVASTLTLSGCGGSSTTKENTETEDTASTAGMEPSIETDSSAAKALKPSMPKPAWAPSMAPEMQVVLEKLDSYGSPSIATLTAPRARLIPTPTQAVMDVMDSHKIPMPDPKVDTMGRKIPGAAGTIPVRVYTPKSGNGPFPIIVYFHGGGWVIADIETYSASAQGLAEQVGAVVVSVGYRQAPEHKFPAAHEDAFAAYQWVLKNAAALNGDPNKVAVAGESAGGNLAANVSIMARDKGVALPKHELLVYPVANNDMNDESYQKYASAKPLDKPMMAWFVKQTLKDPAQSADPRISLVKANLKGLPPTTIIAAELDPLQTEGKLLADKLKDAGVKVDYKLYDGVTHEFFGMATVVPEAKKAQAYAADELKKDLK